MLAVAKRFLDTADLDHDGKLITAEWQSAQNPPIGGGNLPPPPPAESQTAPLPGGPTSQDAASPGAPGRKGGPGGGRGGS
jgi:hypothetical protein